MTEYVRAFQLISQDLAWNEAVVINRFQEGLADEFLDELRRHAGINSIQQNS